MDPSLCNSKDPNLHSQYTTLHDFEQFSAAYAPNAALYHAAAADAAAAGVEYVPYRTDQQSTVASCMGNGSQVLSASQELNDVRYVHAAQYNEMVKYATNPHCGVEPHYADQNAIAYGYAPDPTYGMATGNNFSPRAYLYDDNINGSEAAEAVGKTTGNKVFDDCQGFQKKMSQLTLNSLEVSQTQNVKMELLENPNSDLCQIMRWRDPNLPEVISFLNNPNNAIKANAAAYLQHLCYMDDLTKQRTRSLGGIPPLIRLLSSDIPEIHKNACGALRNLSYGRQNDENKRAIESAGGIAALVNLLNRTKESEVKELVTGVLWNLSSCEEIKRSIIDESLYSIVNHIIKPHSGWDAMSPGDPCFSTVFRNASGVLRNVSSAGEYARTTLRFAENLVDCLLYVVKKSIEKNNIGNKTLENCVCILRNLSYRCQEVEDPNYDKQPTIAQSRATTSTPSKSENLGCFGTNKKKKDSAANDGSQQHAAEHALSPEAYKNSLLRSGNFKSFERLWQPEVVQYYLALLQSCSNPETLEASAGAIQNLSACFWQPSIDIRATVRKEKGLPILVELLRMEVDRVVCAVATALRNLAIDQRNKELIGKYAMRDLVQKLPSGNSQLDQNTSDDTISAVLATINEVIKKNPEFSRSLLDAGGVERLILITRHRQKYMSCVLKFASQVLFTMWQHHELRDVYKKNGWKEQDFVSKSFVAYNAATPNSPNNANNTLSRPMASQGRTRYEDKTIQRATSYDVARSNGGAGIVNVNFSEPSTLRQMANDVSLSENNVQQNNPAAKNMPMVDSVQTYSN